MKKITTALVLAIGAVGISVAPLAGADPFGCQQVGSTTVCAPGGVNSGGKPAVSSPGAGPNSCSNAYGNYQACGNAGGGFRL
jgi:hypothetical protein